ncbi:hypothetical protein BAURA63_03870, partial [Brevibacterium aurantiacum]
DARQRDMIDPRIAALEDDGWTVRIAVLPAIMFPYAMDSGTGENMAGLQRGLGRIAAEDPHPQTVYVLAQGSTAHFSVYADGRLESELTQTHATGPPYVNSEVTAAGVSYTLRAVAADPHEPELLEEETSAVGWTGVRYRALSMEQGDTGSLIMTAAFLAGGVVGLVLLVLALLVLLPRRSGPLARIFGTRIDLVHETSALVSLRERATHSRRKLTRAKRLSSSQETALGRLPAPDETYSPLVWAGWNALADELEGDGRGHCFFRPDLRHRRDAGGMGAGARCGPCGAWGGVRAHRLAVVARGRLAVGTDGTAGDRGHHRARRGHRGRAARRRPDGEGVFGGARRT